MKACHADIVQSPNPVAQGVGHDRGLRRHGEVGRSGTDNQHLAPPTIGPFGLSMHQNAGFRVVDTGQALGFFGGHPGDHGVLSGFRQTSHDAGDLLGGLAFAVDHLGHAGPSQTVQVDGGVIGRGAFAHALH